MTSLDQPAMDTPLSLPLAPSARRHALIVDDNAIDRRRLRSICDRSGLALDFTEACSVAEMVAAMAGMRFDVIFIDYRLDDGDGLGALTLIKKDSLNSGAGTIMVAGVGHASIAVSALKSGCGDYILKDALDPHWIKRAVTSAIAKSRLERDVAQSEARRAMLDTALAKLAQHCTQDIAPDLAAMAAALERMRIAGAVAPSELDGLIAICRRLRDFTDRVETAARG